MKALTGQDILQADDMTRERVDVPEWGGYLFVRMLTARERDEFEASNIKTSRKGRRTNVEPNLVGARARLLALCAVDEEGNRLFADNQVEALNAKSGAALDRCYEAAQKLNKLTDEDIEAIEGNSPPTPVGDSN